MTITPWIRGSSSEHPEIHFGCEILNYDKNVPSFVFDTVHDPRTRTR